MWFHGMNQTPTRLRMVSATMTAAMYKHAINAPTAQRPTDHAPTDPPLSLSPTSGHHERVDGAGPRALA